MRVLISFFKIALKDKTEFSQDLVFDFLNYITYILITAFMWTGVISTFGNIGGWTSFNFIMLTCFAGLYRSFNNFFSGTWQMKNNIIDGTLDKYLCRPVNVYFSVLGENFEPISLIEGIITITVTLVISCFTLKPTGISFLFNIIPSIIVFGCGTVCIMCIKSIVSLLTVWLGDISIFQNILFFEDLQFDRYPTFFLSKGFNIFFNWIVPLGLIATYPAYVLTFNLERSELLSILLRTVGITLLWIVLLHVIYKKAIKHYESFGG